MDRIDKTLFEPTKWLDGVSCLFRRMVFDTIKTVIKTTSFYLNKNIYSIASKTPVSFSVAGYTRQSGSPTYTNSYPIRCNNGNLTWVDDVLPIAYKRVLGLTLNSARFESNLYATGASTLRFSASGNSGNWIGSYSTSDANNNYSFYASTNTGGKYLRYDGESYNSSIVNDTRYNIVITPTGVTGNRTPSTWTQKAFVCTHPLSIGATTPGANPAPNVTFYGSIYLDDKEFIPCERVSDGVLGYYVDGEFLQDDANGNVVSLGYDYSHYNKIISVGTPQTINIDGAVYTFPDLLRCAMNTVLDTVDITGDKATVTRYSTVMKLLDDGGWTRYAPTGSPVYFQHDLPNFGNKGGSGIRVISNDFTGTTNTNFVGATEYSALIAGNGSNGVGRVRIQARDDNMTLDEFLSLLTERNNNGNPSYVIYSTLNPTISEYTVEPIELNTPTSHITFDPAQTNNYMLYVTLKYKELA